MIADALKPGARVHRSGIYAVFVDMECPACGQFARVAIHRQPYFTTHHDGEVECSASRTWVSRTAVDQRVDELLRGGVR